MVLNDITKDYSIFIDLLDEYTVNGGFVHSALSMIDLYQERTNKLADTFVKSGKRENDKNVLINGLSALENMFADQIANMSTSLRSTTRLITEINRMDFVSLSVKEKAEDFCDSLNVLMDIVEEYISNRIRVIGNTQTFFKLITQLEEFKKLYVQIYGNDEILKSIEDELLEKMPVECDEEAQMYHLDIRSYKVETNIASFSDDLKLLAECLQGLERLVAPQDSHSIYIRKIESGSLKAIFSSDKVDFSIFPDLITSISNAIKTWRTTPAEREKLKAEANKTKAETDKINAEAELIRAQAEAQQIANVGSKLAIATAQVDYLCEKLNLSADNQVSVEQIQKFCLPLIEYIENNPIGTINNVSYDVSREVHLLEER